MHGMRLSIVRLMGRSRRRRALVAVAALALLPLVPPVWSAGSAWAGLSTHPYPGAKPTWSTTSNDTGPSADDSFEAEGELFLPLRDPQGAAALAKAVSTPGDPRYRHFVSPADWINRFAPTKSDFDAVVSFLTSQGATISAVPASRQYVVFRENLYLMDSTFQTSMHHYRVGGQRLLAPATAPKLPASIASKIAGIVLDQGRLTGKPHDIGLPGATPRTASGGPTNPPVTVIDSMPDCSFSYGDVTHPTPTAYGTTRFPTAVCAYRPDQMRYGLGLAQAYAAGINGAGQKVAVIGGYAPPDLPGDVNRYALYTRTSPLLPSKFSRLVPDSMFNDTNICGGPAGWQEEDTMDVEAVHAIAPAAAIVYAAAFNCGAGTDYALSQVLDTHAADIVTNSYGNTGESVGTELIAGETNLHLQAAAEGIGLYYASGDYGDETRFLDTAQPNWPASSPWVTSVGGTSLAIDAHNNKVFEAGWGNRIDKITGGAFADPLPGPFNAGSGGGTSTITAQPDYQKGIVPHDLSTNRLGTTGRAEPDIATDANPTTSMLIGFTPMDQPSQFEVKLGAGTSLAAPLMSGKVALAQQAGGHTLGFANPALYAQYRTDPSHFGDIVPLTNPAQHAIAVTQGDESDLFTIDDDGSLQVRQGYDLVTGLGDPSLDAVIAAVRRATR
jgi:subtilase family serine protease